MRMRTIAPSIYGVHGPDLCLKERADSRVVTVTTIRKSGMTYGPTTAMAYLVPVVQGSTITDPGVGLILLTNNILYIRHVSFF